MIEKFHIGFNNIENEKVHTLKLTPEQEKAFGFDKNKKTIWDYLDDYLSDKELELHLRTAFVESIHKTMPKAVKDSCLYCTGKDKSVNKEDRKCYIYTTEGEINEFVALVWFIGIVENNKSLLSEKDALKNLSIKFYECFLFKDGRVSFNLRKLTMYCLEHSFKKLSKIFAENSEIENLEMINKAIENLDSEYLSIKMFDNEEPYHIEPQKMFFESKRKSIKEQLKIVRLKNKKGITTKKESKKPNEDLKELHNNIFKDNAFEVWQSMFEKFEIDKTKRTDIDFMFQVMKYNGLIHENVRYTDIKNWINKVYQIAFDKIKFTNPNAKSNDKRLIIFKEIISN